MSALLVAASSRTVAFAMGKWLGIRNGDFRGCRVRLFAAARTLASPPLEGVYFRAFAWPVARTQTSSMTTWINNRIHGRTFTGKSYGIMGCRTPIIFLKWRTDTGYLPNGELDTGYLPTPVIFRAKHGDQPSGA